MTAECRREAFKIKASLEINKCGVMTPLFWFNLLVVTTGFTSNLLAC